MVCQAQAAVQVKIDCRQSGFGIRRPTFYFDNAHEHALWRKDGVNSFAWNALYGNQVSMREHLYSGDGAQGFDVIAARNTVSTLGQIDLGGGYQITPRFSAFAAYRLLGVTRVGLADNQIPPFWADQQGMQNIKTNGDLILHGVMMGGMWNF